MPITVRHEPGGGMAALAALLGGQGQREVRQEEQRVSTGDLLAQLDSRRQMQRAQIDAQAQAQAKASDDAFKRDAIGAGLAEDVQQREFDNRLTGMQEEARAKASQWEYQFTTKQRQEIAKFNQADQLIDQSDSFSEEEKEIMHRQVEQGRMGITPGVVPADPNKQVFKPTPDGQSTDIGTQWTIPGVGTFTREPDGKIVNQVPYDKTKESLELKHKIEIEKAAEARHLKLVDAARKDAITWSREEVPVMAPGEPGYFGTSIGATEGGPTSEKRKRSLGEIQKLVRQHYPELFQEGAVMPGQPAARSQQLMAGAFGDRPIGDVADSFGIELTPAQKSAPQDVQEAILFLKVAAASYQETPPEDVLIQMRAMAQLIGQWERNQ